MLNRLESHFWELLAGYVLAHVPLFLYLSRGV